MIFAVYQHARQLFSLGGSSEVADDTSKLGEHDYLILLSEMHRNVQQLSSFDEARGWQMTQLSPESVIS